MKLFLTSRLLTDPDLRLNPMNGFVNSLREVFSPYEELVYVSSNPEAYEDNDAAMNEVVSAFASEGLKFAKTTVLDGRNSSSAGDICQGKDKMIILSKGDVFSQNRFFHSIDFKSIIRKFAGTVVAEGGGAMNCSGVLYVMPRTLDQAFSNSFMKFLPGLGLTSRAIIPHFERVRSRMLGNLRYMEDVILSDSNGKSFFALPEGSFISYDGGKETINGPIWHIHDGEIQEVVIS